ncbi:MAG: 16S rRNA (guanine(527)-N(7))-methyltransferase RsmG [Proteobacteria bacterium]|nr:16S rRNA (guanine(527)-N(7))-methyltransferase RsmG [Pseudomonadota bacterium]
MGQFQNKKNAALIDEALDALQIDARADSRALLERYAIEIVHWGRRLNLTGASSVSEFIRGPLFDALTLMEVLDRKGSLVDVGSGGGLPGIPVAILAPSVQVTLVEPRAKRAAFLRHAVHLLGLPVEIVQSREENILQRQWLSAVAQAVWPAPEWLGRALRLIEPGGGVYALTSYALDKTDLPPGTSLERQEQCTRPWDSTPRCSTLIRRVD